MKTPEPATILLVDDDETGRLLVKLFLEHAGFRVFEADPPSLAFSFAAGSDLTFASSTACCRAWMDFRWYATCAQCRNIVTCRL